MKWADIKKRYPNKFLLIGDIVEERISEDESQVINFAQVKLCIPISMTCSPDPIENVVGKVAAFF